MCSWLLLLILHDLSRYARFKTIGIESRGVFVDLWVAVLRWDR